MTLDVRYGRFFVHDLMNLEASAYSRVYHFVFVEFKEVNNIKDLPELKSLGSSAIFYRFTLENHLIGIEVTGQIVKFVRILPKPHL
ncbi:MULTISPECIES: hypothetical protein [Planktothrix]|uniref:Cytotoxic translational repressor of toxin-antitoxin stability system n=2 Tax=Planktothrix TaxID=54304 RepID=A0A4P5ZFK2_PLAAG|nr:MULTISPECIES: hypothetical protein [Planktothrix]CAD5937591.1 hypothetical protein NO108_02082 [Planktothrix rubescens]CAC5341710.1 conserved hypothetical protein [Planktothrix rubescens NIVA-CYA 18]CAD5929206.1 hypothetical protein PCC7821_01165 [Planktothrix rubescens NIVA-CYA 18]CAD5962247.1 hypothetical protein NO758_03221 [Planktothrix agardhii]CAH2571713.1 hypothetical protein PRNO82_01114 [Planktothrix rubescens]